MMKLLPVFIVFLLLICGCAIEGEINRQPGQVVVCHAGKTMTVSNADYLRHVEHGDRAGPCPD